MPLNGSDVASRVSGAAAVANTVAESAKYNSEFDDVYAILNSVRSIAKGYTGASTAVGAYDNIVTKGVTVASASTLDLDTATGAHVDISDTTTITAVTLGTGKTRRAQATGAFQLTASANLIVNGSTSVNYTTTAGDLLFFEGYSGGVVRVWVIGLADTPVGTTRSQTLTNKTISGGTINNAAIGNTTKATGGFTTLDVTGVANFGSDIFHKAFSTSGLGNGVLISSDANSGVVATSANGTSSFNQVRLYNPNGLVGSISTAASGTSFNTTSDRRLKENLRDFDSGAIIDAVPMHLFDWKSGGVGYGPMAQQLHSVFPTAVTPGNDMELGEDGFLPWMADLQKLVPVLWREVQQLRQRVAALEAAA